MTKEKHYLTENTKLMAEWNWEKNEKSPDQYTFYSNQKVWWKCSVCGNEWQASANSRSHGSGCPICGKKKLIESRNKTIIEQRGSLLQNNPFLANEWNYSKNGSLTPDKVTSSSNKKVWWVCSFCGYEWQAVIKSRNAGRKCPNCVKEKGTSFPEQAIFYYISKIADAYNRYILEGFEIDIYLPSLNVAIEYDGSFYHNSEQSSKKELKKDAFLRSKGLRTIRVKESDKNLVDNDTIFCIYNNSHSYLNWVVKELFELLKYPNTVDINIDRDRTDILQNYYSSVKEKSIASTNPELMKDWDYEANGKLNPGFVSNYSNQKIQWKCHTCGHKWQAAVYSRAVGNGCPACSGKTLVVGKNDLLSQNPKLAEEWNYHKNGDLQPNQITVNNGKKVWWQCRICGHEWQASIAHRNNNRGCPECSKKKVIETRLKNKRKKEGSLQDLFPKIAGEWNYDKNGILEPKDYTAHSGEKVWWKCSVCGNEWQAYISNRTKGSGCPECFKIMQAKRSVKSALKRGSIVKTNPEILELWDYEKNKEVDPSTVTKGSHQRVWWKCTECGHSWMAMVSNIVKGRRCPECAKKKRGKASHNLKQ